MGKQFHIFVNILTLFVIGTLSMNHDRIVGGRPARNDEFPYQVSLRYSNNDNHFCGGSIIGPRHILTAAHCMFYGCGGILTPFVISIVAGQNVLNITKDTIYRNASRLYIHEDYNIINKSNDIAIVELDQALPIDNIRIAIAEMRRNSIKSGVNCTVTGWGVPDFKLHEPNEELLAADVEVRDFKNCSESYGKENMQLSPGMMCAGVADGSTDACKGDSGGPLFCNGLLTGIVSFGYGCAIPEFQGIYTEISQYIPWIIKTISWN